MTTRTSDKWFRKPIGRIAITLLTMLIGVILLGYWVFVWPSHKLQRAYLSEDNHGIALTSNGKRIIYGLPDGKEPPLIGEIFAVAKSSFVYFSVNDPASIVVISVENNKTKWFRYPDDLAQEYDTDRLSTDGKFVTMDMYVDMDDSSKHCVVLLDTNTGKSMKLPNADEARIDSSGTNQMVIHTNKGDFILYRIVTLKPIRTLTSIKGNIRDWDYDFESQTLFYLKINKLTGNNTLRFISTKDDKQGRLRMPMIWGD